MNESILFLSLSFVAACHAGPPPAAPYETPPNDEPTPSGTVLQAATCEIGATRPVDDGCNTCTCTEHGWGCTELACVGPGTQPNEPTKAADRCTPGALVDVPANADDLQAICDMEPPDCTGDTYLGGDGSCYVCVPNAAPRDRDSVCLCNDDRRWACTETAD